jgi:hypothetical protein
MNNCEVRRNINEFFFVMWAIYMLMVIHDSGLFRVQVDRFHCVNTLNNTL